jgi:NAD(P)-dependent dehydrogenase (short-subunit alcohol dehydrogenase family)
MLFMSVTFLGIGRATAKLFAKEACRRIAIGDINLNSLEETKEDIKQINESTKVLALQCGMEELTWIQHLNILNETDVTSEQSVQNFISETVKLFGRVDYACNVAGILMPGSSPEFSAADFDKPFSVNARGMWLCQKVEIEQMLKQEPLCVPESKFPARGAIANVASMAALRAYDNLPSYCATKHAILGFTKADGLRYAKYLIRVNAICPGVIATPMLGNISDGDTTNIPDMTTEMAVGRQGLSEEVAECLVWITSDRASLITATTLAANGGMKLQFQFRSNVFWWGNLVGMIGA